MSMINISLLPIPAIHIKLIGTDESSRVPFKEMPFNVPTWSIGDALSIDHVGTLWTAL